MPTKVGVSKKRKSPKTHLKKLISSTAACAPTVSVGNWIILFKLSITCGPNTSPRSETAQLNASVAKPSILASLDRVASWQGSSWANSKAVAACEARSSASRVRAMLRKVLTAKTLAFHCTMEAWTSDCEGVVTVLRMQGRVWRGERREEDVAVEARARAVKKDFMVAGVGLGSELMVFE